MPPQWMYDTDFLAAMMHGSNYLNGGGNHDVWRIDGMPVPERLLLRVNRHHRNSFLDVLHPPRIAGCDVAQMDARTAQSLVAFFDRDGRQVADIQPEMIGTLLGLTNAQRESRSNKITFTLTEDEVDGWCRPAGSQSVRYEPNLANIAATDALLWPLAERISAMPQSFFVQALRDVQEIERNGYGIDPSKATNFMLMDHEDRLGFIDLTRSESVRAMPPCELATMLWQPSNQTATGLPNPEDAARRARIHDSVCTKVIRACDALGIAYAPEGGTDAGIEAQLRQSFGQGRGHQTAKTGQNGQNPCELRL